MQTDRTEVAPSATSEPGPAPATQPNESVQRRFAVTLVVRLSQMAMSFLSASLVPRALGARSFGSYTFLTSATATTRGFAEPSVEQAVYTFSSQKPRTGSLTKLYAVWLVVQLSVLVAFVGIASWTGLSHTLWP